MLDTRCFKQMYNFCGRTEAYIGPQHDVLRIEGQERFCHNLGEDHYTYLTLIGDCKYEIVKVVALKGQLFIDRAIDDTHPQPWPCGTEVRFETTAAGISDLMRKALEQTPEEPECDELYSGAFCIGRFDFVVRKGLITKCVPNGNNIANEDFTNPVLTFDKNGCISCVREGPDSYLPYSKGCD